MNFSLQFSKTPVMETYAVKGFAAQASLTQPPLGRAGAAPAATTALLILAHSAGGTVQALAQALQQGFEAEAGAARAGLMPIDARSFDAQSGRFRDEALMRAADAADILVFAAPTYMGGPSAQFKAFADASSERWSERRWLGKLAAGITAGGSPNGEQSLTLQYFQALAAQHGMAWVAPALVRAEGGLGPNRLGSGLGLAAMRDADGHLPACELDTTRAYGAWLATWWRRLGDASPNRGAATGPTAWRPTQAAGSKQRPPWQGFDHLHLDVKDRAAALPWYERVLGLRVCDALRHWAVDGGPLTLEDPEQLVHLALFERAPRPGSGTLALRVSPLHFSAWQQHLQAQSDLTLRSEDHGLSQSLYFSDPDGNAFEITCYPGAHA